MPEQGTFRSFLYGPCLLTIPANSSNGKATIKHSTDFATDAGVVDSSWLYNPNSGEIYLNYPGTDEQGVACISR